MFNAHRLLPTYKFNFHFKSTSKVVYVCSEVEFKEVVRQPDGPTDRQTDWQHVHTVRRMNKTDRR